MGVVQLKGAIEWESTGTANEYRYRIVDASASSASSSGPLSAFTYIYYGGRIWRKKGTDEYYLVIIPRSSSGSPSLVLYPNGKTLAETQKSLYYPQGYKTTKTFDVRMRAAPNSPNDLLVAKTGSPLAATSENIRKQQVTPNTYSAYKTPPQHTRTMKTDTFSLFQHRLEFRTPPPKARHTTKKPLPPAPNDVKVSSKKLYKNTPAGSVTPTKETAMWGTASGHARAMGHAGASGKRWEWLHLVAHSLGGANARYNLVAGTFDANTKMIPTEREVADAKGKLQGKEYINYEVTARLEPGTHIAKQIDIYVTFPTRLKLKTIRRTIDPTDNTKFSRVGYDLTGLASQ